MFNKSRSVALLASVLAVLAGAVAGCGSGGSSDSTTSASAPPVTQPPADAAFVRDVEAICVETNRRLARLGFPTNDRQTAAVFAAGSEILRDATSEMRAIEPPADVAESYDRFVVLLDRQGDGMVAIRRTTLAGDQAGVRAAHARIARANEEQDRIALDIGLEGCAASAEEEAEEEAPPPSVAPGGEAPFDIG